MRDVIKIAGVVTLLCLCMERCYDAFIAPTSEQAAEAKRQRVEEDGRRRVEEIQKKEMERKASYKAVITNVPAAEGTFVEYYDYSDSHFRNLYSLNSYICNQVFGELRGRLGELTYKNVHFTLYQKGGEVVDVYGNTSKIDIKLLHFAIHRDDIGKFNCDGSPDVFTVMDRVEFGRMANSIKSQFIQECKEKIADGNTSKIQLCSFLPIL